MLFKKTLPAELKSALDSYIQQCWVPEGEWAPREDRITEYARPLPTAAGSAGKARKAAVSEAARIPTPLYGAMREAAPPAASMSDLDRELNMLDESFQQMLLRKIDEKGMKDSACYKRAGVDRKLFSKIRSNPQYKPKKATAIAFCMALELPYDEAVEMLRKAGYALSRSSKFDVIVEYFIKNRRYNIHELNLALYEYDQAVI